MPRCYLSNIIFQQCGFLLHKLPNWMEQILFRILVQLRLFYLFFSLEFEMGCLVVFPREKLVRLTLKKYFIQWIILTGLLLNS
jgi:hypothetical protein